MRVFVESNFVLELAHQQEEHRACEQILALARSKEIHLGVPAFALFEPYTTLERRRRERLELSEKVKTMVRELRRSEPLARAAEQNELGAVLVDSINLAAKAFVSARDSLLGHADILALEAQTFRDASDGGSIGIARCARLRLSVARARKRNGGVVFHHDKLQGLQRSVDQEGA